MMDKQQSRDACGDNDVSVDVAHPFRMENPTETRSNQIYKKTCLICGDKALGHNFNVISCESCKAFFRRNAHKKSLKCHYDNACVITVVSRRNCKNCRLKKCLELGMVADLILCNRKEDDESSLLDETNEKLPKRRRKISDQKSIQRSEPKRSVSIDDEFPIVPSSMTMIVVDRPAFVSSPDYVPMTTVVDHRSVVQCPPTDQFSPICDYRSVPSQFRPELPCDDPFSPSYYCDDRPTREDNNRSQSTAPSSIDQRSLSPNCASVGSPEIALIGQAAISAGNRRPSEPFPQVDEKVFFTDSRSVVCKVERSTACAYRNRTVNEVDLTSDLDPGLLLSFPSGLNAWKLLHFEELLSANEVMALPGWSSNSPVISYADNAVIPQMLDLVIRRTALMVLRIKAFVSFSKHDQLILFKESLRETIVLRGVMLYVRDIESVRPVGFPHRYIKLKALGSEKCYFARKSFYNSFADKWRSSESLMLCLTAILVFDPTRPGLQNVEGVRLQQEFYIDLLKGYLKSIVDQSQVVVVCQMLCRRLQVLKRHIALLMPKLIVDMDETHFEPLMIGVVPQ